MATIALYAGKMNQVPGLVSGARKSVTDYKSELSAMRTKALQINQSICDLSSVIDSIQAASQTQEEKEESLDLLNQGLEQFTVEAVRVDEEVADLVRQRKDNFYEQYNYLKPVSEMNGWEKFCDGCAKAGEWCREHWKIIVTVVIVIAAIILICTGVGGILGAMAIGSLIGAGVGGLTGGIISIFTGKTFFEGFEDGAFWGAVSGMISGGLGFNLSNAGKVALTLKQIIFIGGVSTSMSSLASDLGDKFITGDDISWLDMSINMIVSGIMGSVVSGIGYGISKAISGLVKNMSWFSKAKELFRMGETLNPNYGNITSFTTSEPKGISLSFAGNPGKCIFRVEFDVVHHLHYHCPPLFTTKRHIPLPPIIESIIADYITNYLLHNN
ncbi:MAG: hypothetical protein HFH91_02680 [Lachnospiraceae bacterium]|nr:hypothetical protein [Lachnospiraceae bacterium]